MYKYVNAVTHSDCPLNLPSQSTVPGQAPGLAYMLVLRPEVGMGMGIWIIPDSWRTHATDAGRKYYFRPALGLASVAIRMTYNLTRNCHNQLIR